MPAAIMAVALLGVSLPAAEEAAPAADHAAEFKILTQDFINLENLFTQYSDPILKVPISGHISLLKRRGILLGWKPPEGMLVGGGGGRGDRGGAYGGGGAGANPQWDQVKYDELRYDINQMYQRIASYLAPLRTPPPPAPTELVIDLRDINPDPSNPAEAKAALDLLDREIKRLERAHAMRHGSVVAGVEEGRISRLKERRQVLARQFTQARWAEVIGELNSVQ